MDKLIIEGKDDTPWVQFSPDDGVASIGGRSLPENASEFYKPLVKWVKDYAQEFQKGLRFEAKFHYFNTASSKMILEIFELLPKDSVIEWHYLQDDEDMQEAGEGFESLLNEGVSLKLIQK